MSHSDASIDEHLLEAWGGIAEADLCDSRGCCCRCSLQCMPLLFFPQSLVDEHTDVMIIKLMMAIIDLYMCPLELLSFLGLGFFLFFFFSKGKFEEAEEEFVIAGKPKEAVLMYVFQTCFFFFFFFIKVKLKYSGESLFIALVNCSIFVCARTCVHACAQVCVRVCVCVCVCACVFMCVDAYVFICFWCVCMHTKDCVRGKLDTTHSLLITSRLYTLPMDRAFAVNHFVWTASSCLNICLCTGMYTCTTGRGLHMWQRVIIRRACRMCWWDRWEKKWRTRWRGVMYRKLCMTSGRALHVAERGIVERLCLVSWWHR